MHLCGVLMGRLKRYLDGCMCNNYNEHLLCPNLAYANGEVYISSHRCAFHVLSLLLPLEGDTCRLIQAIILWTWLRFYNLPSSCHNFWDIICVIVFFFQIKNACLSFYFSEYVIFVVSILFLLLQKYAGKKMDINNLQWMNWRGQ